MKRIPTDILAALIAAAVPLLLSILTIVFKCVPLLFVSYLFVVGMFLFCHVWFILTTYLQIPKSERDNQWRFEMNMLHVCHVMYALTIVFLVIGTKMLLF